MKKIIGAIFVLSLLSTIVFAGNEFEKRMESAFDEVSLDAVPLFVMDAISNQGINNARVTINGAGSVFTNSKGKVLFTPSHDGLYQIKIEKEGYINYSSKFEVQAGTVFANDNVFIISKTLPMEYLRIVLEWSDTPQDLDIHLLKDSNCHISYRNTRSSKDRKIKLDRDDRNGYGPETITLKRIDPSSKYQIYVHNYSKRKSVLSRTFTRSCATVSVYRRNELAVQYQVPDEAGAFWRVFNIENKKIQPVNRVYEK